MTLIGQTAVFLAATVIAIPLFRKLGLSAVLGYLAAGIVIGPFGLGFVRDSEGTMHIAEFGVVLLLFVIGLELQLSRLRTMRKAVFGFGSLQVGVTAAVFTAAGMLFGLPLATAFVVGFALSLSSTPLVLQLLAERGQLNTQYGRTSFGALLFQDVAVMPMLAALPLLAPRAAAQPLSETMQSAGLAVAVLLAIVFGGRYALRPFLRIVAQTRVNEAFTAAALFVVIGTAMLMETVGLSMALGAFIAGLLLADSEYRHELEADIEPFKGLLLGLFFITVGMNANLNVLASQPLTIAMLVVGLLVIKMLVLFVVARVTGHANAPAAGVAFSLPQAGEFGFVLFSLAVGYGLMPRELADMLVIVVTLSMIASPPLLSLYSNIIEPRLGTRQRREFDRIPPSEHHVIIAGMGRFGQIVARILRMRKIPFTALEVSADQVEVLRVYGNKVYYGDASRLDLLRAAGTAEADLFVLAIDDIDASVRTAEIVRQYFPQVKLMARARNRQHALKLMDMGVRYIVRETLGSSLEMGQHVLEKLGMSRQEAVRSVKTFREHDERSLQAQLEIRDDEQKLIQTSRDAARELEALFASDAAAAETQEEKEVELSS
ncbi:MAG: monovalent cation:proton antiporter-2 (CPA2) family protein [Steroidobacteraceae bacterium]